MWETREPMQVWSQWLALSVVAIALVAASGAADPASAQTLCIGKESVLLRGWVDSKLVNVQEGAKPAAKAPAPLPPKQAAPSPPRQAAPAPPPPEPEPEPTPRRERDTGYLPPVELPGRAAAPTPDGQEGHCVMGVRQGDTLRIRSQPDAESRELGGIPPNACGVVVGSPCRGSWCPVTYRGIRGWSNASYLRPPWMR
jgi:hypothetical protein